MIARFLKPAGLIFLMTFAACNSTSFKGKSPTSPEQPLPGQFAAPCDPARDLTERTITIPGNSRGAAVTLSGSLCKLPDAATVAPHINFTIDLSDSNSLTDPIQANGSCERFDAIQAIFNRLKGQFGQNFAQFRFSVVTFDTSAKALSGEMDPDTFERSFLKSAMTFCAANAMGLTNYEAAFMKASEVLPKNQTGREVVMYFISDGLPTMTNSGYFCNPETDQDAPTCRTAGEASLNRLRSQLPNLRLNVLYLRMANTPAGANPSAMAYFQKGSDYLANKIAQIQIYPDALKFADAPGDAASVVGNFKGPLGNVNLTNATAVANVSGPTGNQTYPVRLTPASATMWNYQVGPMILGAPGSFVMNLHMQSSGQNVGPSAKVTMNVTPR